MADEEKSHAPSQPSTKTHHTAAPEVPAANAGKRNRGWLRGVDGEPGALQWFLAELIGTMLLVYLGCGSCFTGKVMSESNSFGRILDGGIGGGHLPIAFAFGLAVASVAQALGHISGCHLNPAVTVGLAVGGMFPCSKVLSYILAQCLGSLFAALFLLANRDLSDGTVRHCISKIDPFKPLPIIAGILTEIFITFTLVLVVLGCCDNLRKDVKGSAPLAIGLTVTLGHIMGIRYSGASMNPARSLGPAIVDMIIAKEDKMLGMKNIWIYLAFPTLGGVLAGVVYRFVFSAKTTNPPEDPSTAGQGDEVAPPPTSSDDPISN